VNHHSRVTNGDRTVLSKDERHPTWINAVALFISLLAGAVSFLPFALDTSPWDAVTLRVPGNQGNWWHFLAGAPFFLAFPMIWLRARLLVSTNPSTATGRRVIWSAVSASIAGTMAVETPFLLHLAGTSEWQRFSVLGLGFGIVVASSTILFLYRGRIAPTRACVAGLDTAYLANAALCLVVYSGAAGEIGSRFGWFVSVVIFWPMLFELIWIFVQAVQIPASQVNSPAASLLS
jgi:hypothetical protein